MGRGQPWVVALALSAGLPSAALAHPSGGPAVAWPKLPHSPGERADASFRIAWTDTDSPTPTGTIKIDWYYTPLMPPTFLPGERPPELTGTAITMGIDEEDPANAYDWDTSAVPAGAYWIWSRVHDLPGETSVSILAFSRGVVVVAHSGDEPVPAVAMITPKGLFERASGPSYDVVFEAFDPAGDAQVTLEAMRSRGGEDAVVIASALPAARSGTVTWSLEGVPPGDWIFRASLVDGRGRRAVAYGRFFLTVLERPADAGAPALRDAHATSDGGEPEDAVALPAYDGGQTVGRGSEGCSDVGASPASLWLILAVLRGWSRGRSSRCCRG